MSRGAGRRTDAPGPARARTTPSGTPEARSVLRGPTRTEAESRAPAGALVDLQRAAGNRAVTHLVAHQRVQLPVPPGRGTADRVPTAAKWRLPPSADLQAMLAGGSVPQDVVRSRVRTLLVRMHREDRLRSRASVADMMAAIFPSGGTLDVAAYERYVDPADREMVYHSVRDAMTAPRTADRADLRRAMRSTAVTADRVAGDRAGLTAVFGSAQRALAARRYRQIAARLRAVAADIDNAVTTDYNLDAEETFLGGWANFDTQHMHLLSEVVADPLTPESRATLLHEAAHLAHGDVDDHVYYGTSGFESAETAVKVANAAHYEELPRRAWGASSYGGQTFRPGRTSGGAPLTPEQRIRAGATEFYRRAWDAAADLDDLAKGTRRDQLAGRRVPRATRARLREASRKMDLTLHEQGASFRVTRLDVTTTESIVRGMTLAGSFVDTEPALPMGPFRTEAEQVAAGVHVLVDRAAAAYGTLLGDPTRDRRLLDWLHAHYGRMFP